MKKEWTKKGRKDCDVNKRELLFIKTIVVIILLKNELNNEALLDR